MLFQDQMIKQDDLYGPPIVLSCHTMDGALDFVVVALFCSGSIRLAGGEEESKA